MTDTTDTKALQRPTRKHYDWSKAVWMDCDRCGEAHTGTVLADDGARICAGCCDSEYYSAWEDLAETAIKLLEAERQRADYGQQVIDQRNGECDRLIKEIEALKAKLSNPVVLPERFCSIFMRYGKAPDGAVMTEHWGGNWLNRSRVIENIQEAGFTVKGE